MSWQTLRPQIVTLVNSLDKIQEVSDNPSLNFAGYPAAHVVPSDNQSDYETNKENVRVYAFIVRVFYETKKIGVKVALERLQECVDDVIDAIDQEDLKTAVTRTVGVNLPARYLFLNIFATPSAFSEIPDNELVMAEINVRVRLSVDVT